MTTIHTLIEGQASDFKTSDITHFPTSVLIEYDNNKIVFDPRVDQNILVQALKEKGLTVSDITYVFVSHLHLDHTLLAGIFPHAPVVTANTWYKGIKEGRHDENFFGKDILIIKTSGHTEDDSCLLVKTQEGNILLAGDMFWWSVNEVQESNTEDIIKHKDMFAVDQRKLENKRRKLIAISDIIIPGHGKPFKTK